MNWLNEAPEWSHEGGIITMRAGAKTDFWRKTHDGGVRDTGHLYGQPVTGDFTAEVKVSGQYATLYDQAGLMVRLDEENWMKCGIEFFQGVQQVSVVVTRVVSDWSVVALRQSPPAIWLRVVRSGHTIEVYYSLDGSEYSMLRQAYFPPDNPVQVGVMTAAPTGEGFEARFENLTVRQ